MATKWEESLANAAAIVKADAAGKYTTQFNAAGSYQLPGQLGRPHMKVYEDPRLDSRLRPVLAQIAAQNDASTLSTLAKLGDDCSLENIADFLEEIETAYMPFYDMTFPGDEDMRGIELTERNIPGGDGQDMKIYIYRPASKGSEKLPAVVYLHGGAMTILSTFNRAHDRWCRSMASHGIMVIMPDFRNAWTKEKWNHFPAGLNDCVAATKWLSANREELGIRKFILHGESGGANLSLATSLKANREGWVDKIAGVYVVCPYVSGLFGASTERKMRELPSMLENHNYFINAANSTYMAYFYAPRDADLTDPLAFPLHATTEELKGLPPHVLSMDELDPLRDEGVTYARRLVAAGVSTQARVNLGSLHASSLIMSQMMPEYHAGVAREVAAFAKSL